MNQSNLLDLPPAQLREQLAAHFRRRGQPVYRAQQTEAWIFAGDALDFGAMTDLPIAERTALAEGFCLREPTLDSVFESRDGTAKHLWRLACGEVIESVLIPAQDRLTLCVSSQAGCALACTFCATGWSGFGRQLSPGEIAGQYRASARWARKRGLGSVTNVVFMGMGEPLANRRNVFSALEILNAGYGVGARRITVSTVGVVPGIRALAARKEQFRLAVSLHAPTSALREQLVPLEKRYPLEQLMDALDTFGVGGRQAKDGDAATQTIEPSRRRITFEYTMIRGVNDQPALATPLAELAKRAHAFVNLIPFNPIPYVEWQPSDPRTITRFRDALAAAGVPAAVRRPRGRDIDAACGQLRAQRTRVPIRLARISRIQGKGRKDPLLYEK